MIKRFLGRVFSGQLFKPRQPKIIRLSAHGIARDSISACALRVTQTLQRHEFSAFVVGGAVRDLLLGGRPKDYDVATDATPEEVRALFRRSRIIGRRFRIVHVMCGSETVEVSTFRGASSTEENDGRVADEHGRILRDNVFGSQEQDATRRDFSINALFYDPATQEIWDYHDGVADLRRRRLRMIGAPEARYREDPVRMLRAVRLAASTGLEIDPRARKPIRRLAPLLANVPAARLMDELLKLLLSGHTAEGIAQLRREGLQHGVLPLLDHVMAQRSGERLVAAALKATDERVLAGKSVSPGFLFASLLWQEALAAWKRFEEKGEPTVPALYRAMDYVLKRQAEKLPIHNRFSADMKDIWALQPRFLQRSGKRPYRLLEHPRFRAGYDFLRLRCESGEVDSAIGEWWERFQHAGEAARAEMLVRGEEPGRRRRRRRRRGPENEGGRMNRQRGTMSDER
ncbi:MAG: polynucleotide adenylyltransferase PcnB [Betaproteobacteria bacterium]|nr:polynucleotide adenylyltransferase PcnB [Betaproteobacteria bacterium]MDH3438512.1 polynucleotide adenylyltransferase PcnB [Betaproteobacteria bacterium]